MKLKIADELTLPVAVVTEVIGFLGRRGQGKSYAAQRLAELMHEARAQFVVLDPVGNWWGLRLAADGKAPGIPVPVFGGLHGDVPLEPRAGTMIADVIADRGISAVLDVSQFESDADKARFAHDFGARFYFRRKQAPAAVHLFLEECQEFVPQNPMGEEQRVLHVFQRIAKLGRNYGIGVSLISQRPQEVHKKVLNLTELLFVFQLTGPHERKAVEGWIRDKGIAEDIAAELPKLQRGAPHAWSPAWLSISKVVHITPKWTFDASSTPVVGKAGAVRELAPIDLEKLRTDMAATIERAKADDPRELRKQIAELRKELANRKDPVRIEKDPPHPKVIEKFVLKDGQIERLEKLFDRVGDLQKRFEPMMRAVYAPITAQCAEILARLDEARARNTHATMTQRVERPQPRPSPPRDRAVPAATASRPVPRVSDDDQALARGERTILTAVAQYPDDGVSREQLTVLTGYKRSSRDTYLQRLGARGFVTANGNGNLHATDEGVAVLGDDFEPLPTGAALLAWWEDRLPAGEWTILAEAVKTYPGTADRDAISEATGYKRSSRDTYIQRLVARRLLTTERGAVRASDELFD